jgi:hypothetical protein
MVGPEANAAELGACVTVPAGKWYLFLKPTPREQKPVEFG